MPGDEATLKIGLAQLDKADVLALEPVQGRALARLQDPAPRTPLRVTALHDHADRTSKPAQPVPAGEVADEFGVLVRQAGSRSRSQG